MVFLDPKIDIVFKKLFGTIANKEILINFLNSILDKTEDKKIINIEINDPTNIPETIFSKESIVDVRCTDKNNSQYIVEMQMIKQKDFVARTQYYSALALGRQLAAGENYDTLIPVIFIGILNFNLFKSDSYFSKHLVLDTETHENEFTFTEFYIIELPKFTKEIDQLDSIVEKWTYFLKNASNFQEVPKSFEESNFKKAFTILAESNWQKNELEAYDRYLDARRSAVGQLQAAIEDGKAEGKIEGKIEEKKEIAFAMIKEGYDILLISKLTGLGKEEIETLKQKSKK